MPQLKKKLSSDQSEAALTQLNNCTFFYLHKYSPISEDYRHTSFYCAFLYFTDTVGFFPNKLKVCGNSVRQAYQCHYSNSICSLHVSVTFWEFSEYF